MKKVGYPFIYRPTSKLPFNERSEILDLIIMRHGEAGKRSAMNHDTERSLTAKGKYEVENIDVVLDTVGGDTLGRSWKVLKEGGTLVTIADDISEKIATEHQVKGISMQVRPDRMQLEEIASLIDKGIVKPIVKRIFPLEKAKEAYDFGIRGHNLGKIVLQVKDGPFTGKGRRE